MARPTCFVLSAVLLGVWAQTVNAQAQEDAPTTQRSPLAIANDLSAAAKIFNEVLDDNKVFVAPKVRQAAAVRAVPALDQAIEVERELLKSASADQKKFHLGLISLFQVLKLAVDDPATKAANQQAIASDGQNGAIAQAIKAIADYLQAGQNSITQRRAIDEYQKALKGIGNEDALWYLPGVFSRNPPATSGLVAHLVDVLSADVGNPQAQVVATTMASPASLGRMKAMHFPWCSFPTPADVDDPKLRAMRERMTNKPLTIQTTLVDGSAFSTAKWKGKVILLDMWATNCAPCIGELPGLRQLYAKYHADGLEILSISADEKIEPVKSFLANHSEITWTQSFNFARPGMDAVTGRFNIAGIPAVFVIDRKGILRYTILGHDENLSSLIGKLLAESP